MLILKTNEATGSHNAKLFRKKISQALSLRDVQKVLGWTKLST